MREASERYIQAVKSNTRQLGFRVSLTDERSFFPAEIMEISISRACSDGFQIGAAASDRLCLVTRATDRVEKGARLNVYSYLGDNMNDTEPLGVFYADEVTTENSVTTIIAYDRMNRNLDKVVKWTKSTAPSFPCTQQQVLDYICSIKGITCGFTCQPFMVKEKPVGYTARELLGFIAACHAANVHFSAAGELIFKQFTKTDAVIDKLRCYSHSTGSDNGFTVNGVLFDLGNDTQIYIDGDASEYDDEAEGIVEVFCPFASIEVAEYVWHNLGGLSYRSCALEMPAENLLEVGDVFTTTDSQGQEIQSIVIEQELSVSLDGFKEALSAVSESTANQRSSENRMKDLENKGDDSGGTAKYLKTTDTALIAETSADGLIIHNADNSLRYQLSAKNETYGATLTLKDMIHGRPEMTLSSNMGYGSFSINTGGVTANLSYDDSGGAISISTPYQSVSIDTNRINFRTNSTWISVTPEEIHIRNSNDYEIYVGSTHAAINAGGGQLTLNGSGMTVNGQPVLTG